MRLTLLFLLLCLPAAAQKSAFQSADGRTSLYLDRGAAIFNFAETKFSMSYTNRKQDCSPNSPCRFNPVFYGYELFAKATSGVSTLYSDKVKVPEGGGSFLVGRYNPFGLSGDPLEDHPLAADWLLLDIGYSRSGFNLATEGQAVSSARYFDRYRIMPAYNALINGRVLLGVTAGVERRNTLDLLQNATFQSALVAPSGTNSVVKTKTGFYGNYQQYTAAPVYTDMLFILPEKIKLPGFDHQVGIDAFTRSDIAGFRRSVDGGVGVFLTKKGEPTKVLGGLSATWNEGKIRIAITAGFNFK